MFVELCEAPALLYTTEKSVTKLVTLSSELGLNGKY